jgi:hypothetical protein
LVIIVIPNTTDINGTTITNKYTPGETSATVTKNWDDNNNQDGKRPTEIKVELYCLSWCILVRYCRTVDVCCVVFYVIFGHCIFYFLLKDYTTDINGTTITNKYTPGETSATVTKNWDDNNVCVQLLDSFNIAVFPVAFPS